LLKNCPCERCKVKETMYSQQVSQGNESDLQKAQTDSLRGGGVFRESIRTLKKLNAMGYGQDGSGLELNLVSNPTGAFLPSSQPQTEKRFRQVLGQKWGISFNNLFNFANVPLARFLQWLLKSGNLEAYMRRLASNFNPCAAEGLMCRTLVSVSWDGYLYDCDFNAAKGLFMGGRKIHVSEIAGPREEGSPIAAGDHCYT
jgi:radical SAM/Cys-rich protein